MNGRIVLGVLLALALIAVAVGIGFYAYYVGVAQGQLLDSGKSVMPGAGVLPSPYYNGGYFHRPFGFGFFSCLFPLLFIFLVFMMVRVIFGHRGFRHYRHWEKGYPPMFEEWHRKMHESKTDDSNRST